MVLSHFFPLWTNKYHFECFSRGCQQVFSQKSFTGEENNGELGKLRLKFEGIFYLIYLTITFRDL